MAEYNFEKQVTYFKLDGVEIMPPIVNGGLFQIGQTIFSNQTSIHYIVDNINTVIIYQIDNSVWLSVQVYLKLK